MTDPATSASEPGRPTHRTWRLAGIALVVAVIILATVTGLALIPLHQTNANGTKWFRYTISSPGPEGTGYFVPAQSWCPPANAVGLTLVTFAWTTADGASVLVFDLAITIPSGFPMQTAEVYSAVNVSEGGYTFPTAYPTPCADIIGFGLNSTAPLSVIVTGALDYNYTTTQPIL